MKKEITKEEEEEIMENTDSLEEKLKQLEDRFVPIPISPEEVFGKERID